MFGERPLEFSLSSEALTEIQHEAAKHGAADLRIIKIATLAHTTLKQANKEGGNVG